jgi:hypothetical protein
MKQRRFNTGQDCRRYLASVINRVEAGELDAAKAGRLAYITNILVRVIETSDIEARLEQLEARIK